MEELLTTVILLCFNLALDVNGAFIPKREVPTYYEEEESNNITEVRPPPDYLERMQSGRVNWKESLWGVFVNQLRVSSTMGTR